MTTMATITLEQIHDDLIGLKKEMKHIKTMLEEEWEPSEEVIQEIGSSRKRSPKEFISHEAMRKEFG